MALLAVWAGMTLGAEPVARAVRWGVDRAEAAAGWDHQWAPAEKP